MGNTETVDCRQIAALDEVAGQYAAIFCDVWGVIHNGIAKHPAAESALIAARRAGAKVVLLTNAPRPAGSVAEQLDGLGFDRAAYDHIVTSGDATMALIKQAGGSFFHIGPDRDLDLFADLDVAMIGEKEAGLVVATGLFDDETETPDDYRDMLRALRDRDAVMICANPDIVVHRGEKLIYCAGALAREYASLGGRVELAGKPHRPIYDLAMQMVGLDLDRRNRVLAVGDGLMTDIKGANAFGVDALFVTAGINGEDVGGRHATGVGVASALAAKGLSARYFMATLK